MTVRTVPGELPAAAQRPRAGGFPVRTHHHLHMWSDFGNFSHFSSSGGALAWIIALVIALLTAGPILVIFLLRRFRSGRSAGYPSGGFIQPSVDAGMVAPWPPAPASGPTVGEDRVAELERELAQAKAAEFQQQGGGAAAEPRYSKWNTTARAPRSAPPLAARLAAAPRRVPVAFTLAEMLPFRWWYVFAMFMVAVPPIVVWMNAPEVFAPVAVLTVVVIYAFQLRGFMLRRALLKWGQVATVTGSEIASQGTYYSGTTYSNMIVPVAHGWTVTRSMYSGPKTRTRVRYTLGDYQGELIVGGREYIDGVILADQRNPARALCVTSFPYDLDRDTEGNWVGKLRTAQTIGMVAWVLIVAGWLVLAALVAQGAAGDDTSSAGAGSFPSIAATPTAAGSTGTGAGGGGTTAPTDPLSVSGMNETRTLTCNDNDLTVSGIGNTVTITGHCASLTVSGSGNQITLDTADVITASGVSNSVTFHAGTPQINNSGASNVVQQG